MRSSDNYLAFMEAYIQQLLEDIRAGHRTKEPEGPAAAAMLRETREERIEREFAERIAEVERFIHEDPPHDLSYYCGLVPEQFPDPERLSDEQVEAVVDGYLQMLGTWNIDTDIPEELADRTAYTLLVGLLDKLLHMDKWCMSTWSFCACDPSVCPYGAHCYCKDFDWFKDLQEWNAEDPSAETRERDRLRRRWDDDDLVPRSGEEDWPF